MGPREQNKAAGQSVLARAGEQFDPREGRARSRRHSVAGVNTPGDSAIVHQVTHFSLSDGSALSATDRFTSTARRVHSPARRRDGGQATTTTADIPQPNAMTSKAPRRQENHEQQTGTAMSTTASANATPTATSTAKRVPKAVAQNTDGVAGGAGSAAAPDDDTRGEEAGTMRAEL